MSPNPALAVPIHGNGRGGTRTVSPQLARLGHAVVWLNVFLGAFVLFEPAPYELLGVVVVTTAFLFGMRIPLAVLPLLVLSVMLLTGAIIGVFQIEDLREAVMHTAVLGFLLASSLFFACYVARDTEQRCERIINGWMWGAAFAAALGIIGYFNIGGTSETLTLFGRARGPFQDPNVFGPFVASGALFAFYRVLNGTPRTALFALMIFLFMTAAVFLSFSRGAWGFLFVGVMMLLGAQLVFVRNPASQMRVVGIAALGFVGVVCILAIALSIPEIAAQLQERAQLTQSYDTGRFGRFGRHLLGISVAIENPAGIGVGTFARMFGEDPHNVYLKSALAYAWPGFFAFISIIMLTLVYLTRVVLYNPCLRGFALPFLAIFVGLALLGAIIDVDRWRQFYLTLGVAWGLIAADMAWRRKQPPLRSAGPQPISGPGAERSAAW